MRKHKGIRQLPNRIGKRIESASFVGPARRLFRPASRRPHAASGWGGSAWKDCLDGENLISPEQSGPKAVLQLLRGRGGENPAKRSNRKTGWGPASESLRVVALRPAEGEQIFSGKVLLAESGAVERRKAWEKFFCRRFCLSNIHGRREGGFCI